MADDTYRCDEWVRTKAGHRGGRWAGDAAAMFANVLDRLAPAEWDRTVVYSYPRPWERSLRWVAVHTMHEVQRHRMDIERQVDHGGR